MLGWRVHFSVSTAVGITHDENSVYMATANGIVKYDTEDNSVETISVANGLSDLGISEIASDGNDVIIGYSNGNLDLIKGNSVTNIPWIKLADVAGNKEINSFYFTDKFIYISTGVGVIVYDRQKNEIKETYFPYSNPQVYGTTFYNDTIFCATENGIYFASKDQSYLNNTANWTKKTDLPSSIVNEPIKAIITLNSKMFFVYDSETYNADTLYSYSNGNIEKHDAGITFNDFRISGNELIVTIYGAAIRFDEDLNFVESVFEYSGKTPLPGSAIFFQNHYWLADKKYGLVKAVNSWSSEFIYDNSPYTDGCYRLDIQYGKVLVAGGGLTHNLVNNYFRNGVYVFEDERWTNFNHETQDSIDYNTDWDFVSVAINPNNTDEFVFCGNSQKGIKYVSDGTNISDVFNTSNSTLESVGNKIAVGDMRFDEAGNLWVANTGTEPLKVRTPQGDWYSFSLGSAAKDRYPYRLFIDSDGNKWVALTSAGLVAFNDNGTLGDPSDDELRVFSTAEGYGNLPSQFVKAIAEDLDGEIWIGTEEGMVVLYSTSNIFDGGYGEYDFNPILLEVDGEVEKVLGTTYITGIAVDGGNRKWIGTNSAGVFCLSPDGMEVIYNFNTENSPLISNNVLDIRIDHLSGEVYFATDKGLVSFRSDASLFDEEFSNVTVFPNPVRPEYEGVITVQGLGYDSDVTITDVSGNVVLKTVSNGGTAIWDGKTLNGDRVQSGVYLVWSASSSGKGKNVAKILVIN